MIYCLTEKAFKHTHTHLEHHRLRQLHINRKEKQQKIEADEGHISAINS